MIDLLDYTPATAAHHGRLLAYVRKSGTPRGAHDLIIAAHAAETGRTVVSKDAKPASTTSSLMCWKFEQGRSFSFS